jgi:hypothetical protein
MFQEENEAIEIAFVLVWNEQIHKQQLTIILQSQRQRVTMIDDSVNNVYIFRQTNDSVAMRNETIIVQMK